MGELTLLLLFVLVLGAAIFLVWKDRQITNQEQVRLKRMHDSPMYSLLYPALRKIRRQDIETVRIRHEDVAITLISRPGLCYRFHFNSLGFRQLSDDQMHTLALLLERDIPVLADHSRYRMRRENYELPNGQRTFQFVYIVRHQYKNAVNRAPYYDKRAA